MIVMSLARLLILLTLFLVLSAPAHAVRLFGEKEKTL